eukprot:scaffold62600_cov60-Phaeocystis_antarctica.AAC.3
MKKGPGSGFRRSGLAAHLHAEAAIATAARVHAGYRRRRVPRSRPARGPGASAPRSRAQAAATRAAWTARAPPCPPPPRPPLWPRRCGRARRRRRLSSRRARRRARGGARPPRPTSDARGSEGHQLALLSGRQLPRHQLRRACIGCRGAPDLRVALNLRVAPPRGHCWPAGCGHARRRRAGVVGARRRRAPRVKARGEGGGLGTLDDARDGRP